MLRGFISPDFCYHPFYQADGAATGAGGTAQASEGTGTTGAAQETSEGDGKKTAPAEGGKPAASAGSDDPKSDPEKKFTQADLDAKVDARLAEEKKREANRVAAAKKKADEDALAANNEWKTLAEQRADRILELERGLAKRDQDSLRFKIATKHKLPDELAELLKGETEADLEEHAKKLAKLVGPPKAADTEAGRTNHSKPGQGAGTGTAGAETPQTYAWQSKSDIKW